MAKTIRCPACGGPVRVIHNDEVNRCEYCASPVLGPDQDRDCVNHPGRLANGVCHVCGDLLCEECMEKRVADYGGKLFTIVNCTKSRCKSESSWAKPLNEEYHRLTNMDWANDVDNKILRVTGLGAILMMVFELVFIISMLYIRFFTDWGWTNIPNLLIPGDTVIILGILGNLLSAFLLQTSLQVYVHERQLAAGMALVVMLIIEAAFLIFRGLFFNLLSLPNQYLLPILFVAFGIATLMVFSGSLLAIRTGYKKRKQIQAAKEELGLTD